MDLVWKENDIVEQRYMVHMNSGRAVFVKEGKFFDKQVAENPSDTWHTHWKEVYAEGIEHARLKGKILFGLLVEPKKDFYG